MKLLSQKVWVLWLRAVLRLFRGCFEAVLGLFWGRYGAAQFSYARGTSTMQLTFLSEALIQNLNLLSQKTWVICCRAVRYPYGAVGAEWKKILHWFFGNKSLSSWSSWLVKKFWSIPTFENYVSCHTFRHAREKCVICTLVWLTGWSQCEPPTMKLFRINHFYQVPLF